MSTKPMKPLAGLPGKGGTQVQVDLRDAETIKCNSCSNYLWITSYILKKLSAIVSPNGQEALIPVQVYSCGNCGQIAEGFLDEFLTKEESKSDKFPSLDI